MTPAWALPPLQIAQQLISGRRLEGRFPLSGEGGKAQPARDRNPVVAGASLPTAWARAGFRTRANATVAIDRNYAPIYSELGLYYESTPRLCEGGAGISTAYLLLAPEFRGQRRGSQAALNRNRAALQPKAPPTLRREIG